MNGPSIVFSANLRNAPYNLAFDYFVIGSPNHLLSPNISFSDEKVMHLKKLQSKRSRKEPERHDRLNVKDVLQNGNRYLMAILLLMHPDRVENVFDMITLKYSSKKQRSDFFFTYHRRIRNTNNCNFCRHACVFKKNIL